MAKQNKTMKEEKEDFKYEDIVKTRIPNEEIGPWMQTLRDGGFTDKEIDMILSGLNVDYRKAKNPHFVEEELSKLKRYFLKEHHRILTTVEIEYLKKGIQSRLED